MIDNIEGETALFSEIKMIMKSAFIAISYKHHKTLHPVLDMIRQQLLIHGYSPFVFVEHYNFQPDQTKLMMATSTRHIRECDLFIAELTHKAVGVGIEAGYAHACGKPIIYAHNTDADISTTLSGIADYHLAYAGNQSLQAKLQNILKSHTQQKSP